MPSDPITRAADAPDDIAHLRALIAAEQGQAAVRVLDRHLARPRYRPDLTRIAERDGAIAGYILVGHQRRRLGAATIEAGCVEAIYARAAPEAEEVIEALLGGCLELLLDQALPLATCDRPVGLMAPLGFAPYRFAASVTLGAARGMEADGATQALRPADERDLEDLAALYEANYRELPLAEVRAAPDWRAWLVDHSDALALEDSRGRVVGYAAHRRPAVVVEAAAADAGAARALCAALLARAAGAGLPAIAMALPPAHPAARAALHLGGVARLVAPEASDRSGAAGLAGIVDLPGMLQALVPEFERRLAGSRYEGWSGSLRIEIETERVTLPIEAGRVMVIDGARPADVRLRNVALPALAQLCLGYRAAADLRAAGGLACDDAALGLIDTLFPAVIACGEEGERLDEDEVVRE